MAVQNYMNKQSSLNYLMPSQELIAVMIESHKRTGMYPHFDIIFEGYYMHLQSSRIIYKSTPQYIKVGHIGTMDPRLNPGW